MTNSKKTTLSDWQSQGFHEQQGANFAQDIHSISPLALFVRALPGWVEQYGTGAKIVIDCQPGMEGAAISLGFDHDNLPVEAAQELIERLSKTSRLMEIESQIELLRGVSSNHELINKMVEEADGLAHQLSN